MPEDAEYLGAKGFRFSVVDEAGYRCVVIHDYEMPGGYNPSRVDLLVRLPSGYPDTPPDMFWCDPRVVLVRTGGTPQAAEATEQYLGRTWQRFSRHLDAGQWQSARDRLQSYLALIRQNLIAGI